jgi:hypothetical protein
MERSTIRDWRYERPLSSGACFLTAPRKRGEVETRFSFNAVIANEAKQSMPQQGK